MKKVSLLFLAISLILGAANAGAAQDKAFMWTGENWKEVSLDGKLGYIFGIGNLADYEVAAAKAAGQPKAALISRAFVEDLKNKTVLEIVQDVDRYFQENPDKLKSYVIDVVLRRFTTPGSPGTSSGAKK
jgi:hypothetical protein